jgi:RNA polymerase sigma factor (sigma-70 family)
MTEEQFDELQRSAFAIAYRMLGSVSEAEDIVQEAFLRIHRAETEGAKVESPKAYLSAVVTRLSIDQLKSARVRRERYVGQWLPEPIATDDDAAAQAETADSLSMAFLVLLESLTPVERAVFLLREVFDYDYAEIAKIVQRGEDNCRQLLRAAAHRRRTAAVRSLTRTARRAGPAVLRCGAARRDASADRHARR